MPLITENFSCLIVEDDSFKSDSVQTLLTDIAGENIQFTACTALSTATATLTDNEFDLVIIDMSIPSHPAHAGEGSPFSFPSGGLEVLFLVNDLGHKSTCIILTQYPEIEVEGILVPISQAAYEIETKFGVSVAACIQYLEDDSSWKTDIKKILTGL